MSSSNPYADLPPCAYWKTAVAQENPFDIKNIYKSKLSISRSTKIAMAGSCFSQLLYKRLKSNGYNVLDLEPAPAGIDYATAARFGFSQHSARYGNIYTVKQLCQLAQEVSGEWYPQNHIWSKNGQYYDALRPGVEPFGLSSPDEVTSHRKHHLKIVRRLFEQLDVFIFTMGLTEAWSDKSSGTVFPVAPGVIAGEYSPESFTLSNAKFPEVIADFKIFKKTVQRIRGGNNFNIILLLGPIPMTATASGKHVLCATAQSHAILRAAAGQISDNHSDVAYFPAYEILTNPRLHSVQYSSNLRTLRSEAIDIAVNHFFQAHPLSVGSSGDIMTQANSITSVEDVQCEEALVELLRR